MLGTVKPGNTAKSYSFHSHITTAGRKGFLLDRNTVFCYTVQSAAMVRAANKCVWLMRSRKENCGKSCVGAYCKQHNYPLKKGMKMPTPCRVCGVGVLCDSRICLSCGGSALKKRLIRKHKKAKETFELVLREFKSPCLPLSEP